MGSLEEALDTVDAAGAAVGEELARIGYVGSAPCPAGPPHAYLELHIEQALWSKVQARPSAPSPGSRASHGPS